MQNRYVPTTLVCLTVLLTCKALFAASSCKVVLDDPARDAVIKNHGTHQPLQAKENPQLLPDCSQLEFVSDVIHVVYEDPNGETHLKTCHASTPSCGIKDGTPPSVLEHLRHEGRPGGKQMDKAISQLPGIPHGKVFSLERAATLNLAKAGLTPWNLTLLDASSNKPLYRQSGSTPMLQIPNNLLRPGGKYTLVIDGGTRKYQGGFDLLGGTEAADIAKQIKQALTNAGTTARAKQLDELIICYENNLDYEVELLREELKL